MMAVSHGLPHVTTRLDRALDGQVTSLEGIYGFLDAVHLVHHVKDAIG
jgi:hypothetical protein